MTLYVESLVSRATHDLDQVPRRPTSQVQVQPIQSRSQDQGYRRPVQTVCSATDHGIIAGRDRDGTRSRLRAGSSDDAHSLIAIDEVRRDRGGHR
jgi:hypothetical protein